MRSHIWIVVLSSFLVSTGIVHSQSNDLYYHSIPTNVASGEDVLISQFLFIQDPILHGTLFFRVKGELSFQEIQMEFEMGSSWFGEIPANRIMEPGIEYVTILTKTDGGRIAMPLVDDPFSTPMEFRVQPRRITKKSDPLNNDQRIDKGSLSSNYVDADILILSPDDGSLNRPDGIVIAASLFNASLVDQTQYQVLVDGNDLTNLSIIIGDVFTLVLYEEMDVGLHSVKLLFKTKSGMDVTPVEWAFNVNNPMENIAESFQYNGSVFAKTSSNSISGISIDEDEISGKFDGELSWVKARYTFRNSSRETEFSQPLNRSTLTLQITDYLKLEYGDVYPSISPYILNGKRVTGQHYHLAMPLVDVHWIIGDFNRAVQFQDKVDGAYVLLPNDTKTDSNGVKTYTLSRTGYTFPQEIIAGRIELSLFNKYRGGIHLLKSKDVHYEIDRYALETSMFTVDTSVFHDSVSSVFTYDQFDNLYNVDVLRKNWENGNPKENIALGFDFESALDNRKLLFQMGWNFSMTNNNIWDGFMSLEDMDIALDDSLDGKIGQTYDTLGNIVNEALADTADILNPEEYKDIFTINTFMTPLLPIDPIVFEENKVKAILNMPSSAFYFRLKGSYSFNNLLMEYRQIGPEYESFGNPYLTNNIREFVFNDRLSALGRRLMIAFGYKYRDNNLSETVIDPLVTKTLSFITTLVPGPGAPSLIFNFQTIGRSNDVDSLQVDSTGSFITDNREDSKALNTMISVNIPGNFGFVTTTTSISVNSINYTDNLVAERNPDYLFQKTNTQSISITLSSRFQFPLRTSLAINTTNLNIPFKNANGVSSMAVNRWSSASLTAQYSLFETKLRIRGGMNFMTNGEKDDSSIRLFGVKIGGDIDIINNLSVSINGSLRMNKTGSQSMSLSNSGFQATLGYKF